jgi:hypothetical protein
MSFNRVCVLCVCYRVVALRCAENLPRPDIPGRGLGRCGVDRLGCFTPSAAYVASIVAHITKQYAPCLGASHSVLFASLLFIHPFFVQAGRRVWRRPAGSKSLGRVGWRKQARRVRGGEADCCISFQGSCL